VVILNKLYTDYSLPLDIYIDTKKTIEYELEKNRIEEYQKFIDEQPHKLKIQLSMYLHESRYQKIKFLKDKNKSFITWICPLLKPFPYTSNQFVYHEGDDVDHIFFLTKGKCCFVMPSFDNTAYIEISIGDNFGIADIVGSSAQKEFDLNKFIENINLLSR
jgi:hypothetical protein